MFAGIEYDVAPAKALSQFRKVEAEKSSSPRKPKVRTSLDPRFSLQHLDGGTRTPGDQFPLITTHRDLMIDDMWSKSIGLLHVRHEPRRGLRTPLQLDYLLGSPTVHLEGRGLREIPQELLRNHQLKNLVASRNPIQSLPSPLTAWKGLK